MLFFLSLICCKAFDFNSNMQIVHLVSECEEFAEVPVRHSEDGVNESWASALNWRSSTLAANSPHLKVFLLLQAWMQRAPLPVTDYVTDTKSVLDQVGATFY